MDRLLSLRALKLFSAPNHYRYAIGATLLLSTGFASAQGASPSVACCTGGGGGTTDFTTSYFEQGHLIRAGEDVVALGPNLMGDTINEYSGTLSFTQNDFSIPGNNALSMAVGRHLATGTREASLTGGLFGDWDLEIPHLQTLAVTNATGADWFGLAADGVTSTEARCSQFQDPPAAIIGPLSGRFEADGSFNTFLDPRF